MPRHDEYDPEYIKLAEAFFDQPLTRIVTRHEKGTSDDGKEITIVRQVEEPTPFPTIGEFCAKHKISVDTLHQWKKKHPEFRKAMEFAAAHQERILINNMFLGRYKASNFANLVAVNILNWKNRTEVGLDEDTRNSFAAWRQQLDGASIGPPSERKKSEAESKG